MNIPQYLQDREPTDLIKPLYSIPELAELLRRDRKTIMSLLKTYKVPLAKVERKYFVALHDLNQAFPSLISSVALCAQMLRDNEDA